MKFFDHIFAFDANSPLLFTQFYFWAFFALVFALFALIMSGKTAEGKSRLHLRNVYLLFVSWFFYYKTSGLFLLILAFVTLSDWIIAGQIHKHLNSAALNSTKGALNAKILLVLSVVIDLGLLAYFKYAYFFTNMINDLFGTGFGCLTSLLISATVSAKRDVSPWTRSCCRWESRFISSR